VLVGLRADNDALEAEDFEMLFEVAEIVSSIEPPSATPPKRTSNEL
jgi:hypothetical protein